MKRRSLIAAFVAVVFSVFSILFAVGCESGRSETGNGGEVKNEQNSRLEQDEREQNESGERFVLHSDDDIFSKRDKVTDYSDKDCIHITLNGNGASSDSDGVLISDGTVTITEEAEYIISGVLDDGRIIIDSDEKAKIRLILKNADITCSNSAALYVREADKVFVTLADGSENYLSNGGSFVQTDDNNIDAAVFSKQDITFNGSGKLTVSSPAGHAITCKDDLVITGGSYTLNASSHGLDVNDSVGITGATTITADVGKDGIHCENSDDSSLGYIYISSVDLDVEAEGDGISAGAYIQINDGSFSLLTGGGSENGEKTSSDFFGGFMGGGNYGGSVGGGDHGGGPGGNRRPDADGNGMNGNGMNGDDSTSMKGIKAGADIFICGGSFKINSADDGVHSNSSITVDGGSFDIASGDDAFHADDSLTVNDGDINISESYEGLEAHFVSICGGNINLVATDDGLNAAGGTDSSGSDGGRDGMFGGFIGGGDHGGGLGGASSSSDGSIVISGGNLYINASGDGIDANGTLEIGGGYTVIVGPTQGDTATLDYDISGVITGGTFIGTGASGMAQSFSDSEQGVIAVGVGSQSAGTQIILKDKNGNTIIEHSPVLPFEVVILSTPDMVSGESYELTVGTSSREVEAK